MGRQVQRRLQPLRRRRRKKERKKGIEKHIFRNKKRETSCVQTSLMKTTRNPPSSSLQSSEAELAFCGDIILTPPFFFFSLYSLFSFCFFLSFFLLPPHPGKREREREELVSSNSSLFIKCGGTKKVTKIFTSDAPCFFFSRAYSY